MSEIKKRFKTAKLLFIIILIIISVNLVCIVDAFNNAEPPIITEVITTDSYVKLTWKNVEKCGTFAHHIYRKVGKGAYKEIAKVNKETSSYVDGDINEGKMYYYKVSNKGIYGDHKSMACKVVPVKFTAPKLNYVKRFSQDNEECAKISWESDLGQQYYVYRKTFGKKWKKIASVKAEDKTSYFIDKNLKQGIKYIYTCKKVVKVNNILYQYGDYENSISTVEGKPKVSVDCQNLKAVVNWERVPEANLYKVYRKIGPEGSYRVIGETSGTSYTDIYKQSVVSNAEKKYLCANAFVDPSINPFVYTVKAVKISNGKESYSDYFSDGDFHIETPTIVSVVIDKNNNATYEWATLKNAKAYYLYAGYYDSQGDFHWNRVDVIKHKNSTRQTATVKVGPKDTYFTVKAKFVKDGKTVYSKCDENFTIQNRKYSKQNILYIGDSITFGSPYKEVETREVFSYPWRVQRLTGAKAYNPSIPGATYAYNERTNRARIVTDIAENIKYGKTPENALHENNKTYRDFDVVVMAAGTNDYSDNIKFGELDSSNINEFNGAVNQIMMWIKEGSDQRVAEGKKPIKVVFVELFYSDRTNDCSNLTNRFVTKNGIGLTLADYQNNYNELIDKYKSEGFDIYQFDTTRFVNQSTCPYVTADNLHMSRYTYAEIGNKFAEFLIDNRIIEKDN